MAARRATALIAALGMLPCLGAAQNVTVRVDGVPLGEVIEQLKLESSVEILTDTVPHEALAHPITYEATDVPIKRALREIACRAGLRLYTPPPMGRTGRSYRLMVRPPGTVEPPTVQAGSYLVALTRITISDERTLHLDRTEPLALRNSLVLSLQAEADTEQDAAALLAVHPLVTATDNTGTSLEPLQPMPEEWQGRSYRPAWQETVHATVTLAPPAKQATSLASIAGELVVAAEATPIRFEFDAAKPGEQQERDGYTLRLDAVQRRDRASVEIRFTMTTPTAAGEPGPPGPPMRLPSATCTIVLADGTEVLVPTGIATAQAADGGTTWHLTCRAYTFRPGAQPAKVLYSFFHRSSETTRVPFEFQNIPLPTLAD